MPWPAAGSQEPEALSELAVTLQGQKEQRDRVVRRGLDGHGWVECCTHGCSAAGWRPQGVCQEDGTASEWPLSPLLLSLRPWQKRARV